jgi:hypothetical protein
MASRTIKLEMIVEYTYPDEVEIPMEKECFTTVKNFSDEITSYGGSYCLEVKNYSVDVKTIFVDGKPPNYCEM